MGVVKSTSDAIIVDNDTGLVTPENFRQVNDVIDNEVEIIRNQNANSVSLIVKAVSESYGVSQAEDKTPSPQMYTSISTFTSSNLQVTVSIDNIIVYPKISLVADKDSMAVIVVIENLEPRSLYDQYKVLIVEYAPEIIYTEG